MAQIFDSSLQISSV